MLSPPQLNDMGKFSARMMVKHGSNTTIKHSSEMTSELNTIRVIDEEE
jgi:hypothetical protein